MTLAGCLAAPAEPAPSAARIAFTVQPVNGTAGQALAAVEVTAQDAFGNTATGFTGDVTMTLVNNATGAVLSGTTTVTAVAGIATFTTLTVDRAGVGYTLGAFAAGLIGATSAAFDVTP